MKNLLIFINPTQAFYGQRLGHFRDCTTLAKIQIDNSLSLGWKPKDILLVTNFDYKYNGIKALKVDINHYCPFRPLSTKTTTVTFLLEKGLIKKNELYWVHDFDAFQNQVIDETDLELDEFDAGFTDYGWSPKWSLGSYFLKNSAVDIFKTLKNTIYEYQTEDERALTHLTKNQPDQIRGKIKRLNITYNFGMRNVGLNYQISQKPLKVLHFHPNYSETILDCFMYGKNELNKPLMSKNLIKIFHQHGIK